MSNADKHPRLAIFDLSDRVVVITGGGGMLGGQHAAAIAKAGGIPVLIDIHEAAAHKTAATIREKYGITPPSFIADITDTVSISRIRDTLLSRFGRIDGLINNAANNPKMKATDEVNFSRFESFSIEQWNADIAVSLTGAFVCSKIFGSEMAKRKNGVIVNIASDLALIAPDQRIYRKQDMPDNLQPVKPVTYSVVKSALIGLTRYLATYWADAGVRVNAISPGGVYNGQPEEFVKKLSHLIPMGRMAHLNEYEGAVIFLCSDASSYMTGANIIIDGGRTCW